jgi:hypothetical protein
VIAHLVCVQIFLSFFSSSHHDIVKRVVTNFVCYYFWEQLAFLDIDHQISDAQTNLYFAFSVCFSTTLFVSQNSS